MEISSRPTESRKARHSAPLEAHRALVYFRQLYLLERELAGVSDEERCALRRARALPLLGEFKAWLDTLAPLVVPKTELASAVGYALNQWDAFVRYCEQGWLLIDNTRSERALRPIAIGRSYAQFCVMRSWSSRTRRRGGFIEPCPTFWLQTNSP